MRIIYDAFPAHNGLCRKGSAWVEGRRLARAEDEVTLGLLGLVLCSEGYPLAFAQDEGADEADDRSGYEVA